MAVTSATTVLTEQSDGVLLSAAYAGDEQAFEELFMRHRTRVYNIALRVTGNHEEAEEVTIDVFLRLHQHRLARPEEANVGGWLYRGATNGAFNAVRARQRRRRWLWRLAGTRELREHAIDPAHDVARKDDATAVLVALAALSERHRNVLTLRSEGFSYQEIAEALQMKPSSVGTTLARAEQALRQAYESRNGS